MPTADRPGRVADPVHGYVQFTGIERLVIDHRVTQRLRYISQTAVAHLVYPEVRTSRFSHSLGTMHLATRFLAASLKNADEQTRSSLCEALKDAVVAAAGETGQPQTAADGLQGQGLEAESHVPDQYKPFVRIAEQAVRLAALFHDLGHLPFSHDFEGALEDYWREFQPEQREASPLGTLLEQQAGAKQIHERIGRALSLLILREEFDALHGTPQGEAARISFNLAYRIIGSEEAEIAPPAEAAKAWLHTLVDGELDVDRCDYILRDGRNYGFEFAVYDLNRLLDNIVVKQPAGDGAPFLVAVKSQGTSAVETFLLSRFRSYQYGVRHHKVAQVDEALRVSIAGILRRQAADPEIQRFVADLGALGTLPLPAGEQASGLLERWAGYDDVWWTRIMRGVREDRDQWLELVCWRQAGPISLWKRAEEFPLRPLRDWNSRLPSAADREAMTAWYSAVSKLRTENVLVVRHKFVPWKVASGEGEPRRARLQVLDTDGSLTPINERSSLVNSLFSAWDDDIQVHAFKTSDCELTAEQVIQRLPLSPE